MPILVGVPVYLAAWVVAAVTALPMGAWRAHRAGFAPLRSIAALVSAAILLLIGSKGLYLIETALFPLDDYVPQYLRGWAHGYRIPGGVALLALSTPLTCRAFGLPWRSFGDSTVCALALALICIRLGCFLNGCCFGAPAAVPWSVRFPRGSLAHLFQVDHGLIPISAAMSLPVHPLQLYFAAAAAFAFAWSLARRSERPGATQCEVYLLFFASTAIIEPFRANALTLNTLLLVLASVTTGTLLLQLSRPRHPLQPVDGGPDRSSLSTRSAARCASTSAREFLRIGHQNGTRRGAFGLALTTRRVCSELMRIAPPGPRRSKSRKVDHE